MTWALCLNCGTIKFGALCPCPECQVSTCGDTDLDILFSDHHLAHSTLEALGGVIALLRDAAEDPELRFAAFLYYMTHHHPQILEATFTSEGRKEIEALLATLDLPTVTIRHSRGTVRRPIVGRNGPDLPEPEPPGGNGSGRDP